MNEEVVSLLKEIRDEFRAVSKSAQLWKTEDVARYLGVSAQSARNRVLNRADFPKPLHIPGVGRRWKAADVKGYAERAKH